MLFTDDDDRFRIKNRLLAESYGAEEKEKELKKRGFDGKTRQDEPSCFNCKLKVRCADFNNRRGATAGAASFSADDKMLCPRYIAAPPTQAKGLNDKQVKNLLKSAMKGKIR